MRRCFLVFTLFVLSMALTKTQAASKTSPKVVVSIAPIHSLVMGVMEGVGEPLLLIQSTASPHHFSLRPSHMKMLHSAQLVVRIGKDFEQFLNRPLSNLGKSRRLLNIVDLPDLELLPYRDDDHAGHHHTQSIDPHVWLDPDNAQVIVKAIVILLGGIDGVNKIVYQNNGQRMLQALQTLDERLTITLSDINKKPYLVLHDAYYYFENHYQLNQVGAVVVNPERRPGARRLSEIRKKAAQERVSCIFGEPQMAAKYLEGIAQDSGLKLGMLDPLGVGLKEDQTLYFQMMNHLAESLVECLSP
ncbi:MAG: zinc ABC transporter substrate-binding protein [Gammaproteobacteria bacterium]|nr:zinc ABC transporter substrate-binding protein [Gammaproteobacteria bacterium]